MDKEINVGSLLIERLKYIVYAAWSFANRFVVEKRRWKQFGTLVSDVPLVYYGHDWIPARSALSGGALIKFQDLNDWFPNTIRNANILYLVNSALPSFPEMIVREAKRHGARFVLNQNGVAYPAWHGPGWEKTNRPNRFLLKNADYVIYQSRFCKTGADKFLAPCSVDWTILHNPVNTKIFAPPDSRPVGVKIILAGSHQHLYRICTALEAFKIVLVHVPMATLTIAGRYSWKKSESVCLSEARALAEHLGVREKVQFYGGYSQAEAPGLLQKHHILLHTQYNDCCPRLIVEAMSCGLPVVYSKSGGTPELVGEKAGVGVPAILDWEREHHPAPAELANAMIQIIPSLENFSEAARERAVKLFDLDPWKAKHTEIFNKLLHI